MTLQASQPQRSPLDLRRDLGARLRVIRLRAGLSGKELAERLGCHPSKVSRLEHGAAIPSVADVRAWCAFCEADDQADDLAADATAVEAAYTTWRSHQRTGMLRLQQEVGDLFARTNRFLAYESRVIPGLLQTADYSAALLERARIRRGSPDDISDAVAARHEYRRVLDGPATFGFLVEEHVLRSPIAPPAVMRAQLDQLIEDSRRPTVSLGVIPIGPRERSGTENFYVYDQTLVRVQLLSGRFTINAPGDVAEYLTAFEELSALAVVGEEACALIRTAVT